MGRLLSFALRERFPQQLGRCARNHSARIGRLTAATNTLAAHLRAETEAPIAQQWKVRWLRGRCGIRTLRYEKTT